MERTTRMRAHRFMSAAAAVSIVVTGALVCGGCGGGGEGEGPEQRIVPVAVVVIGTASVTPVLDYSGTIQAWREASVGAVMSGRVERFRVEPGDRVSAGDLLVEMTGEQLTQAEAQYVAAEKDWERMKRLHDRGAVSEQAFDRVDAAYQAAKASYELVLESTRIRAPFGGVVSSTYLEEGEVFVVMPGVAATTPAVVELVKMDTVKVRIAVAERDLREVHEGLRAELTVAGHPGRVFTGTVRLVEPTLSASTRTAIAEIAVRNTDESLRPGMYAHVKLFLDEREIVSIPHDGIIQQEGTGIHYAMVVDNGTAHRRDLELGAAYGEYHELLGGVAVGDSVITAGRYRLPVGAAVEVRGEEDER
jgi:membrane fusion protein (multidrug efflux system)